LRKQLTAAAIATCLALVAVRAQAGTVDVDYRNAVYQGGRIELPVQA